ncbi:MAG: response regulator [Provencibacterium sp.]|nr:response regulator [Provencibacterium sp.]
MGFECLGNAENGRRALEFIQTNPVDVILSDIVMPVMNGIELARRLHEQGSGCKLVFLSGHKDFEYAQQALAYGVRYYILKPTRHKEITEIFLKLREELDESRAAEEPLHSDQWVEIASRYIAEHYADASLDTLAELLHMHPFYVSKLFKQKMGRSFSDSLMEAKMRAAARLLANPALKTYEVSDQVGYTSAKNFTRAFKSFYGMTPYDYKNSAHK